MREEHGEIDTFAFLEGLTILTEETIAEKMRTGLKYKPAAYRDG